MKKDWLTPKDGSKAQDDAFGFIDENDDLKVYPDVSPTDDQLVDNVQLDEKTPLTVVTRLSNKRYELLGKVYQLVQIFDKPGQAYLVEASLLDDQTEPLEVDISLAIQPYNWDEELERVFPDIETVRQNARLSFWLAGAFDQDAVNRRERNGMFDTAFPYRRALLGDK